MKSHSNIKELLNKLSMFDRNNKYFVLNEALKGALSNLQALLNNTKNSTNVYNYLDYVLTEEIISIGNMPNAISADITYKSKKLKKLKKPSVLIYGGLK